LTEFDLPGDEYGEEIEHLRFDPSEGWSTAGSSGGDWVNPFSPPQALLEKYVVLGTGVAGVGDGEEYVTLMGGLCSRVVTAIELEQDGQRSRISIDPLRRTFLVGTQASTARVRFLDQQGGLLHDHRGQVLEYHLAG
jgi:hypothetical protein